VLGPLAGSALLALALLAFAAVGIRAARRAALGRDAYLAARGTQGATRLALSLFASALGAWILFSPPEVGTFAGLLGIAGYALGQALAIAAFAVLGPLVRARLPEGTTALGFVRRRYGRPVHAYAAAISVLYMFVFLTAELTAIGGAVGLLVDLDPIVPIAVVAAVTAGYTAYGGLPASIATDRWQAWLVLALVLAGAVVLGFRVDDPLARAEAGGVASITGTGAEVAVVLVVAIVAANLFHQGFWQRMWAARDDRAVVRGSLGAATLILPVVFLLGAAGAVAAAGGPLDRPSLALFALVEGGAAPLLALVVVLAAALVASTADTLQNGLTALVSDVASGRRLGLAGARLVTVLLTVPAAAIAVEGLSVLRLFLVADLLAATLVFPVFLGLWSRVRAGAALVGALAGVLAVVGVGWAQSGTLVDGLRLLTLPDGLSLAAFLAAPLASAAVTLAGSVRGSNRTKP
jgi:solute:Na+ symporter, SSS family